MLSTLQATSCIALLILYAIFLILPERIKFSDTKAAKIGLGIMIGITIVFLIIFFATLFITVK